MKQLKKLSCMTFLRMIAHRNSTATKWRDKPLWGTCAYRKHQRMGYFSSGHALKKSSFTLFLKQIALKLGEGGGGVGTCTQQSFHDPWSTPIKTTKMWVKWPVWRISTGDLTALTKSATQAYLLFAFLILCFLQWQWNISNEVILFRFSDCWSAL